MVDGKVVNMFFKKVFNNIAEIYLKVDDDSMSAIHLWNTVKGGLPHLPYILCNPETLGK